MKDCFGGAWQRLLIILLSFCQTTGCLEIICLDLVQPMTLVLACMLEPFLPETLDTCTISNFNPSPL